MNPKSKVVAYLLLLFFGFLGAHKFYVGKIGMGIIYLFTGGLYGFGVLIDLFTLGSQVDIANAIMASRHGNNGQNVSQNVVVNVTGGADAGGVTKTSAEKTILKLANDTPQLTVRDIVSQTDLELDDVERALDKLAQRGLLKEIVDENGKKLYDAS